ncbi:redoxin domain-containing protein [Halovenus sp. WSH3]|uniref:Redoxin domain-containing protein n=1 Tax=Halovenus carboxidivorans TaxID=2692199 RepID=A0A6B0SXA5_9EURY|nr:redoxin domain-containing protein [Halovenus carboxidivorans]MXR50338.1 redoxin domain-containing protein [Halovenus carboxidivorans]
MIESGDEAPSFTLPGVRDGEIVDLDLDGILGEKVVILAFYPGDFNPACSGGETGLDALDLFTMQKDVQVLAISGDSVYSHRAFAEEYDLHMPLLSDSRGTVADAYGVAVEDDRAGYLATRAVIVVDHAGTVQYTWAGAHPEDVPAAEKLREAVEDIGDSETAQSRYRVGHAHYMEGRRAFTSAMNAYEDHEWMMAQTDFTQAAEEFDEAGEEFNTAVRFAGSAETRTYFERAEEKAEALWRAADWLADSASAFASGEGARGDSLRGDAEAPLETARDLHEPPDPDEMPPEDDPAEQDDERPVHLAETDGPAATLDADIDDRLGTDSREETVDGGAAGDRQDEGAGAEIDDEELEEITAELEEQTEAADLSDPEPEQEIPDEPEAGTATGDADDDVDLELTDPTAEDQEDEQQSDDTGDHGVPDSL